MKIGQVSFWDFQGDAEFYSGIYLNQFGAQDIIDSGGVQMILSGKEIETQVKRKRIEITPFSKECLNPNSYDFHLSKEIACYENEVLDSAKNNPLRRETIPEEGVVLSPTDWLWE